MTMFSMKPKFDLAEFLATPASAGATKFMAARRRGKQFQSASASEDADEPAEKTSGSISEAE